MEIVKPIIVFGVARSGTTAFQRMLSNHSQVAWLSRLCDMYPDKPQFNRLLMKAFEVPVLNKTLRKYVYVNECYNFWEYHCKGFKDPCRDLLPSDVSNKSKTNIRCAMYKLLTKRKNRLSFKITGWPRVGFLVEIFNDAKFIHVIRDGRATANSLLNVSFWWGWRGPQNWRWGPLSPLLEEEWKAHNQSFVVLAAIQWKILMAAAEQAKRYVRESNLLEVKYENLCSDPVGIFRQVTEFADLNWTNDFQKYLGNNRLRNTNDKWEKELNAVQQRALNDVLKDDLSRYGYL